MAVKSPCVSLCRFDGRTGLCTACLRTLDEARAWKKMGDPARHRILNDRTRREKRLAIPAPTSARDLK
jgi:predicted Fe-S protein YdhL (DUF1289 family)